MHRETISAYTCVGVGLCLLLCVAVQWSRPAAEKILVDNLLPGAAVQDLPGEWFTREQASYNRLQQDLQQLRLEMEHNTRTLRILEEVTAEGAEAGQPQYASDSPGQQPAEAGETGKPAGVTATVTDEDYLALQSLLDQQLGKEDYDGHWAPVMQEAIITALQQETFLGSELTGLACQSSLCRIDVQHQSTDAEAGFLHQFVVAAGFTETDAFYTREEQGDGSVRMRYYISRNGQNLPTMAQAY